MSVPPRDRFEFRARFGCSFLFFGFLLALLSWPCVGWLGLALSAFLWLALTLGISVYAALKGDEAWKKVLDFIQSILGLF